MGETSEQLAQVSETQIVRAFRRALVALYPILRELDCISDDTQLYDPYDRIVDTLWDELVLNSLQWKYGLDAQPRLPSYGFTKVPPGPDGFIRVESSASPLFRLVGFIGDRSFGPEPFNSVMVIGPSDNDMRIPFSGDLSFHWERA
jgi:hypothetical protein